MAQKLWPLTHDCSRATQAAMPRAGETVATLEGTLAALIDGRVSALRAEIARLGDEVRQLRRALPPQLVSVREAARLRGVSLRTARRRVRNGEWPVRREGQRVYVDFAATHIATDEEILEGSHGKR